MNVEQILKDRHNSKTIPFEAVLRRQLAGRLQEYLDETEHQGDPMPPEEAIPWMYDFALYNQLSE